MSGVVPNPPPNAPAAGYPPVDLNYQGTVTVERDTEHLRILAICWYVFSGLTALFGCFPIIHLTVGLVMILSPKSFGPGAPPPAFLGWFFVVFASAIMLVFWTCAILGVFAARGLQKRRWLTYCHVVAAIACLQVPMGTLLGIFTFIVLSRPGAKAQFDRAVGRA